MTALFVKLGAWILTNRTLSAAAVAALIVAGLLGWNAHLRHEAERLKAKAAQAEAAQKQAEHTVRVTDQYHAQSNVIRDQVEREADALHKTPGADVPYDPARRADLCAALGRLRNDKQPCQNPGQPQSALPPR